MTVVTRDPGRAWTNRNFRRLWGASAVSTFGSEVAEIAIPLLAIVTLSASAAEVGALRTAQFLPFLLVTLPLGMVVDRFRRLPLMIGADLGRFALVAVIPVAVWTGAARIELLYLVVFAAGILTVLYQIADFAFLPEVVTRGQLVDANGKIAATQSANEIGGRGFGGLLIDALSAPFAVAINAVAYAVSALSLRRMSIAEERPERSARTSWSEVTAGLRAALRHQYIRPLLGEATTFNLFNEVFILGLMLFTARDLGMSAGLIGLIFTAGGVGSFVGAWFGSRLTGRFGYGRVLLTTLILGNTAPVFVVAAGDRVGSVLALFAAVFAVMGIGIGIANVHGVSLRQTALDERLRGRVNAAYRLISWGAIPIGATVGGVVAEAAGARMAMGVGAAGMASATLWVAFSSVRGLATIDESRPPLAGTATG